MYPRLFVLTQGIDIMPSQPNIIDKVYKFTNLDFRDKITGIPLQYDVYVQKIKVKTIQPKGFFFSTEIDNDEEYHYIISTIEVNNILGNDPTKTGVNFYFKVNGTTEIINIKYRLFEDILADLGSYYSIFDLLAQILSKFYADFFVQASLINAVFTFNEYETKPKQLKNVNGLVDSSHDESQFKNSSLRNSRNLNLHDLEREDLKNYDQHNNLIEMNKINQYNKNVSPTIIGTL